MGPGNVPNNSDPRAQDTAGHLVGSLLMLWDKESVTACFSYFFFIFIFMGFLKWILYFLNYFSNWIRSCVLGFLFPVLFLELASS